MTSNAVQLLVVIGREAVPPASLQVRAALPRAVRGSTYTGRAISVGGVPPYSYAVTSGTLPAGMALNSSTGEITGPPSTQDYYEFEITSTDGNSDTDTVAYAVHVGGGITIDTELPHAEHGIAYSAILSAVGGTPPYTWSDPGGTLSGWASLVGDTIVGTPDNFSNFPAVAFYSVRCTDANGNYADADIAILKWPPLMVSTVYSAVPSAGFVTGNYIGQAAYRHGVSNIGPGAGGVSGGPVATYSIANQPPGLAIDSQTGAISGIATTVGYYTTDVTCVDSLGGTATQSFPIRIYENGQMKKHSEYVGDGLSTDIVVAHNFAGSVYSVQVFDTSSGPQWPVDVAWQANDLDSLTLSFKDAPAVGQMLVQILG